MTENGTQQSPSDFHFDIAIAGQSALIKRLGQVITSPLFKSFAPEARVSAMLLREGALKEKHSGGFAFNGPVFTSARAMFADTPNLRMVLDISSGGSYEEELRREAPHGVTLLSPSAVIFICRAVETHILAEASDSKLIQLRDSFLAMLNQMDEDVFIMDSEGYVLEANEFFLDRKEARREDYVGLHCRDLEGEELCCIKNEKLPCPWNEDARGHDRFSKIFNSVNKDGAVQYWRVLMFPLPSVPGRKPDYIFMRKDISQFVSLQQRMQQTEKMAAIGELSTFVAHEIRNPLFSIGGFANSLLRTEGLDEQARQKARVILEESHRLDAILKSILNFAKPTEHEVGEVNVDEVVRGTAQLMGIGDGERGTNTVLELQESLPKARGNADLLRQGLINIIKNAHEAMPDGGTLRIKTGTRGHMIEISVQDTGSGISHEHMAQIFNPFFSTKNKGSGLGLAMTRKSLEDMGGKLELESEPGKGTVVHMLLLPLLAASPTEVDMHFEPGKGTSLSFKLPPGS